MTTRETFAKAVAEWKQSGKRFSVNELLARWAELDKQQAAK